LLLMGMRAVMDAGAGICSPPPMPPSGIYGGAAGDGMKAISATLAPGGGAMRPSGGVCVLSSAMAADQPLTLPATEDLPAHVPEAQCQ